MTMSRYLKKCPFCGKRAVLRANYNAKKDCWFTFVQCIGCYGQSRTFTINEDPDKAGWDQDGCIDAIDFWNMRTFIDD